MGTAVGAKSVSRKNGRKKRVVGKASLTKKKRDRESDDDDECAISSPIVVLKKKCDIRRYEKFEDCFILDFDPFEVPAVEQAKPVDEDVSVISEKGQLACRDYPHSRHLCLEFPFDKTPHESYCKLCYCYVCDTAAPCRQWKLSLRVLGHCHAYDRSAEWKRKRELAKGIAKLNNI